MRRAEADNYRCPETTNKLTLNVAEEANGEVISGELAAENGNKFPIRNSVVDFTFPFELKADDEEARQMYDQTADVYDEYAPLTFMTFGVDETEERESMVDDLRLKPDSVVLEFGAGTGRDSELIARRLGKDGKYYIQDLSPKVLDKCMERLQGKTDAPLEFSLANGCYLPFPDNYFDAVFHFGGINTFSERQRSFDEISRVTKVGGRVVIGDEGMPPWLRNTEFGKVLMNSNPYYKYDLPMENLPSSSRDVRLRWIIGSVFYVFDYTVGDGDPKAVLDFEIPGARGGTHLTRYYGHLEGVTNEAKELAYKAREKTGKSMHKWLDDVIREAAAKDLG